MFGGGAIGDPQMDASYILKKCNSAFYKCVWATSEHHKRHEQTKMTEIKYI